jgi:hypothetical protein
MAGKTSAYKNESIPKCNRFVWSLIPFQKQPQNPKDLCGSEKRWSNNHLFDKNKSSFPNDEKNIIEWMEEMKFRKIVWRQSKRKRKIVDARKHKSMFPKTIHKCFQNRVMHSQMQNSKSISKDLG